MPISNFSTDVLIVGAGPGGATTSLFLAKMGISHCIVDAAVFPRDKVCGDGLDLKVVRVLHHLDPAITTAEMFDNQDIIPSWGARIITPNGKTTEFRQQPSGPGEPLQPVLWTTKRLYFDNFLVKKIDPRYADFRQGLAVEKIERDGKTWLAKARTSAGEEVEIRTKLIIGADGDHSVVLSGLGERRIERTHYAGTVRQYWKGLTGLHPDNLINIYLPKGLPLSYFYFFPLPNGEANVGYGMVSSLVSAGKHNLRQLMQRFITEDPVTAPYFQQGEPLEEPIGWGIPLASRRRRNFGDGYLLVGDAASLVCPTSGEGIGTAMMSGFVAAHFVQRALEAGRFDAEFFKDYDHAVYRRLEGEIRAYQMLMRFKPWRLYDWGLNVIAHHPLMQRQFQGLYRGWLNTAYTKEIVV